MSDISPAVIAAKLEIPASALRFPEGEDPAEWQELLNKNGFAAFEARLHALPPAEAYPLTLALYLREAAETFRRYETLGLPAEIFWNGVRTLAIWRKDCLEKTGIDGIACRLWPYRFLNLEVFRLGRLEYEPALLPEDVRVAHRLYPEGTPCLNVHIPAGDPLDLSAVHYSLAAAPGFWRHYFGKHYELFHCASWLLSPVLIGLLPEDSNILRFQANFTVYKEDYSSRQAEERVFGRLSDNPADYPADSRLQQALKAYLLSGGKISLGLGILPLEMPEGEELLPADPPVPSFGCGGCQGCR